MSSKKRKVSLKRQRAKLAAQAAEERRLKKLGIHPDQLKHVEFKFKDLKQTPTKYIRESKTYPSLYEIGRGNTDKKESPQYTGDKLLGIATMHKSNMVPVFDSKSAEDISKMRRN